MYKLPIILDLSHNKLKKLTPPKMKVPQIHSMDVSHNVLSQLPANFNNLQCMTRLDLSGNHLETVSEQLGLTKYVRWLDVSRNRLVELPESFCALGYALNELHATDNRLSTLPQNVDNLKVDSIALRITSLGCRRRTRVTPRSASLPTCVVNEDERSNPVYTIQSRLSIPFDNRGCIVYYL